MKYNSLPFVSTKGLRKKATFDSPFLMTRMEFQQMEKEKEARFGEPDVSAVLELASALHAFSDKDLLLEFALDSTLRILQAHAGSLFIWEEKTKELVLKNAVGPYLRNSPQVRVRLQEGICGRVAYEGTAVLAKNLHQDPSYREYKPLGRYQSSSFISLPLLSGNKLLGVMNITEKEGLGSFDEQDLVRADALGRHIAIAHENLKTKKRLVGEIEQLTQEATKLTETLSQQEPLASIGKLAVHLAHELNNPLDAIRRFVNLALDQVLEDSLAREYLLKAKKGIRQSIQVIRGLLCFSREARPQAPRKVELHEVIEKSLVQVSQSRAFEKIHFRKEFCGESVLIEDWGLKTVFQNLFDNAHHAMQGAGTITIATRPNGRYVFISVRDTGSGVAPEYQRRIFQPFFTTKDNGEGTGIGLAICREIVVERSGGEITFESQESKGTTFLIKLPYQKDQNGK